MVIDWVSVPLTIPFLKEGFGYKWSPAVRWEDLIAKRGFTLRCPHNDQNEASFRFQAWAEADAHDITSKYCSLECVI